ncbi:uncharacterized protein LOC136764581 [Amia ocellicauda]|uniref:uncharacterized protein LOC136764581 n=1 Tax=Amia ocellicauda TaxID=2972642 RepID=UPI003464E479
MSTLQTVELASLGRPFQLGMLYDCRRDVLIPGITLWDAESLQKDIDVRPQPNTDFQIISSDSTEDKASALNVEASLEASFLSGLVSVKGSASYLHDKKTSKRQSRVTLQYRTTTRFEQLTMDHLGAGNIQYLNVFQEGSATHVVTAILYGAQAFFVFDREVSSSENHQEIQGSLHAVIKKIPTISIEGQASLKMTDKEREQTDKFSCKFYGDFALENNPVTFEDALKTYAVLPQLLGKDGEQAVPMKVWLYPLTKLDSQAAQIVRQISIGLVRRSQRILDELDDCDVQCKDLMKDPTAVQFPEIKRKLHKFKDMCSEYKLVFQKSLAKLLPSIRGGGEEEGSLVDVVNSKERSPFQNVLLTEFLEDKEREMNMLKSYLQIMNNIPVVSSSSDLDKIVLDAVNEYVLCFAFTSLKQREQYLTIMEKYLMTSEKAKGEDWISQLSHEHGSEKWFRSVEVPTLTRQNIRLFLDFEKANKSSQIVKFCVASINDDINMGSSVYLFERGALASKHFELPSKPGVPKVLGKEHDRVHLQLHPPKNGVNEIVKYRVLYQKMHDSVWTEVDSSDKTTKFTVSGLDLNTSYQFSCQAVCKPGVSFTSDASDYCKTLPSSPPGTPQQKSLGPNAITITWDMPLSVGEEVSVIAYEVEYREGNSTPHENETQTWIKLRTTRRECSLENLKAGSSYIIRISSDCGKEGKSLPSAVMEITTPKDSEAKPQDVSHIEIRSDHFLNFSELIQKGQPSLYRLSLEKEPMVNEYFQEYTFGKKVEEGNNKVIIVLGATGAGKTTLINAMINYVLGVQWGDQFRYKLIHEDTNRSQAESQTSIVTSYELHNQKGFLVPYSITVIDTPGFGDTRGLSHDKLITEQVKQFFSNPEGVDHIDAVCFVVQASLARLTSIQQYVFDSILSIFGKDIAENIFVLVTFVDGKDIPVLSAIEAAQLPCHKNQKGKPTHFEFNNSAMYTQNKILESDADEEGSDEDEECVEDDNQLEKIVWSSNFKQMKKFFKTLEKVEGKDLTLTKKVLEERGRLEMAMTKLLPQITAGLGKMSEIKKIKECLENEQANMEQNQNFETEIVELVPIRQRANHMSTNCNGCRVSCHQGCFLPSQDTIEVCAAMDDEGNCVICPGHCNYSLHSPEMFIWKYEEKKVKKTVKELKDNFVKASGKFMSTKEMLDKLEADFHKIEDKIMWLIRLSSNCLARLEEIALKPNTLSTVEYIDLLIRNEEEEGKPGFQDRVSELQKMKQTSEILAKIANNEKLLPEERKIIKERSKRLSRVAKEFKQISSVMKAINTKK